MIKLTDRTLTSIDLKKTCRPELIIELCKLIAGLGVDFIEISVPLIKYVGKLPEGPCYILRINEKEEKKQLQ